VFKGFLRVSVPPWWRFAFPTTCDHGDFACNFRRSSNSSLSSVFKGFLRVSVPPWWRLVLAIPIRAHPRWSAV